LRDHKDATNDLKKAVEFQDTSLALLDARKKKIFEEYNKTLGDINTLDDKRKDARRELFTMLDSFEKAVMDTFRVRTDTFFNCLSQLSFTNVHEPVSALAMGVSQVGVMVDEANKNVLTDAGDTINKKWLVDQVEAVKEDADLRSEFQKRADGFISDEGSFRLLVRLDKFRDLCKEFYTELKDARTVRKKLDNYIELIVERSRYIDYCNSLVRLLLDLSGEYAKLKLQSIKVQGEIAAQAKPGLPAMTTFVSGLYEGVKAQCLSDLYHAHRAYAFWALKPYSGFFDLIGRSPGAINHAQLSSAYSALKGNVLEALGKNYRTPNRFPAKEEDERSMGRVVALTKKDHPGFFDELAALEEAEFELEPATKKSAQPDHTFAPTKAAWCDSRPDKAWALPNPFHGMADVRLTKVRVWMIGEESKLDHNVTLVHLGEEQFRDPDDKPYPERFEPAGEKNQDKRKPQFHTARAGADPIQLQCRRPQLR
jgi:hypothetical protein